MGKFLAAIAVLLAGVLAAAELAPGRGGIRRPRTVCVSARHERRRHCADGTAIMYAATTTISNLSVR